MSDSETDPLSSLLSSFALGPAWARAAGSEQQRTSKPDSKSEERPPRREDRGPDNRGSDNRRGGFRDREAGRDREGGRDREAGRRPFQERGGKFDARRDGPPRNEEAPPAEGVRVTLIPDPQAVHLIGKEVQHVARVYPLYDVAKILLAERARCRAVFEAPEPHAPLLRGKIDETVFLTRGEANHHLWQSELRNQFIQEETIEVDPPTGNFQSVARCGMSGEWLGPPNFHSYQVNLRRLHRERFSHLPFAAYAAKVRTERGEDAVNAWLETTKKKTRWRIKGTADDAWIEDRAEAERSLVARCFEQAFAEVRYTEVLASIPATHLSPSLLTSLQLAGNHARNHPAVLIPAVCRAAEAEHLPVFKRQGKLLTGPARPHPLPPGAILAERPAIMVDWIRANKPAKLEGLWKAVLPEGGTAPPSEFAADLFWLLHQGHILLFTDDTLYVQETREPHTPDPDAEPKTGKSKKKKSKKSLPNGEASTAEAPAAEAPAAEAPAAEDLVAENLTAESLTDETPSREAPVEASLVVETTVEQAPSQESDTPAPEAAQGTNAEPSASESIIAPEPIPPIPAPAPAAPILETPAPAEPETAQSVAATPPIESNVAPEPMPETSVGGAAEPQSPAPTESQTPQPVPNSTENAELSKNPSAGVDVLSSL